MKNSIIHIFMHCRAIVPAFAFLILLSCSSEEKKGGDKVVSVYGKVLYEKDIKLALTDVSPDAMPEARENFIDDWIDQQVIVHLAEKNIPSAKQKIKPMIEKYRASLLMFEYEKSVVNNKLDTVVTDEEVKEYYKENIKDFELDDYLVQAIFIKTRRDADDVDKVNYWFRSKDSVDLTKMHEWSKVNAINYYNDSASWLLFADIEKMIPKEMIYNKQYFVVNKLARKYDEEEFVYFFRILDFRTGISPLEFESENIKSRILQMRIASIREQMREDIINEAYKKNKVKRY